MANGERPKTLGEFGWWLLDKHGAWAFWGCLIAYVAYTLYLQPQAVERKILIDTFQECAKENTNALNSIAKNTDAINLSTKMQEQTLSKLNHTLSEMQETDLAQREILESFTTEMLKVHPEQASKLDRIIEKLSVE